MARKLQFYTPFDIGAHDIRKIKAMAVYMRATIRYLLSCRPPKERELLISVTEIRYISG